MSCFGDTAIDRYLSSQVDDHCSDGKHRLPPGERQRLEDAGLDERDMEEDDER